MTQRDIRIDFIRGMGILMIAIDHFGGIAARVATGPFILPFVTWKHLGWSSAAEFFVFCSGYLVGSVFMPTLESRGFGVLQARCMYRAWQIYAANLLTYCAVLLLLHLPLFADAHVASVTRMDTAVAGDMNSGMLAFLTLRNSPMLFDILNLYLVFLMFAAALLGIARTSPLGVVLISGALWLFVQWNPDFNPGGWHFNPYAWQFVFVLGIVFSHTGLIAQLIDRFGRIRLLTVTGLALVTAFVIKVIDKTAWSVPLIGAIDISGTDKGLLGPLRLAHFLVSFVFILLLMPASDRLTQSSVIGAIARVGRHSLECFCLSTVFVYASVAFLSRADAIGSVTVFCFGVLIAIFLCLSAGGLEWLKAKPWHVPRIP